MQLPDGFIFATGSVGLRRSGADDILLIVADSGTIAAGTMCRNTCCGAPVTVTRDHLAASASTRAVLVNAGCANAATGARGIADAEQAADWVANALGCDTAEVLVASTGVIGQFLPLERFENVIPTLAATPHTDIRRAAKAIMTTDLVEKIATAEAGDATVVGISKGSGMIAPDMATTLTFVMTDARIAKKTLDAMWREIVDETFNMVSVDACESTSDMAIVLASGKCDVDEAALRSALRDVAETLAKKIARDGEGATTLVTADIVGADTLINARMFAHAIIRSDLVKTAIHGRDPNWGRIVQTLGGTHLPVDLDRLQIFISDECVFKDGAPQTDFDVTKMFREETVIRVELAAGEAAATAWGCDLSKDYITINADYHT